MIDLLVHQTKDPEPTFDPHKYTIDGCLFNSRTMFNIKSDYSQLMYPQLRDCINILENMPSAKQLTQIEWGLGIMSTLSIYASPFATWTIGYVLKGAELTAMVEHKINQLKQRGETYIPGPNSPLAEIREMKQQLLLLNYMVPLVTAIFPFIFTFFLLHRRSFQELTILSREEYKKALSQYDILLNRLTEQKTDDVEKIVNMLELMQCPLTKRSDLLEGLYKFKSKYDGVYLFWAGTRNSFFNQNDIYRTIFSTTERLLIEDRGLNLK
ncbi:hypothetical protein [uncultured Legionella sp.]|uniref:hypothetical protein n=1 Tax=uncultured Legionella sp. TaxID=210934 RepID=UPI00263A2F8F|nr:hypothetical protein [uncultured Legionella sp.]